MNRSTVPVLKDIVLVGAGHAHVAVLRRFGMKPIPGVRLTLVTRQVDTPYSGMLPGFVAGLYDYDDIHIDTGPLARFAGARLYQAEVEGLDLDARRILARGRPPIPFDLLSIDIGSTPGGQDIPGVGDHAIAVKPIDTFLQRLETARQRVLDLDGKARIAVVGAGPAGVELAFALRKRFADDLRTRGLDAGALEVVLISGSATVIPALGRSAQMRVMRLLAERGIAVVAGRVTGAGAGYLMLGAAQSLQADLVFWTTEAKPAEWLRSTGLALDQRGFIAVDRHLRSLSHDDVFAAGDIASVAGFDLPKSGVYAVRQGPVLARNLGRKATGRPLLAYKPQREALYLVSTGDGHAVGARNGVSLEGGWVWRWKDRIDWTFMRKYKDLPAMAPLKAAQPGAAVDKDALREISAFAMRCGGCGAKVGANVLSRALGDIVPASRSDVVIGLDAPDDAAIVDNGGPLLSIQTVDYFRSIVDDPYLFGRIAATHALGDVYAMGGEPQTALAIATIPYGREAKVEAELRDLMIGANEVLSDAGCALVGGHTSEGAELALGFSITGLVAKDQTLRKGGLRPGDLLILTKPIGTGSLLAADMRGKAKARWVMAALQHMTTSNAAAARVLARHGVHAATDVTGFGLIGHLVEMVRASGVDVTLKIAAIPVLDGARQSVAQGIFSSLQPENVRLRRAVRNLEAASTHPDYPLLFDPQTAGGLLAALPSDHAVDCIAELRKSGYPAAILIGRVESRSDDLAPIAIDLSECSHPSKPHLQ